MMHVFRESREKAYPNITLILTTLLCAAASKYTQTLLCAEEVLPVPNVVKDEPDLVVTQCSIQLDFATLSVFLENVSTESNL